MSFLACHMVHSTQTYYSPCISMGGVDTWTEFFFFFFLKTLFLGFYFLFFFSPNLAKNKAKNMVVCKAPLKCITATVYSNTVVCMRPKVLKANPRICIVLM